MKYKLRSTRHAKYLLHAHIVFTPKYRKKIFTVESLGKNSKSFKKNIGAKMWPYGAGVILLQVLEVHL